MIDARQEKERRILIDEHEKQFVTVRDAIILSHRVQFFTQLCKRAFNFVFPHTKLFYFLV